MREKLIELLMESGEICYSYTAEDIADHLIATGVTIHVRCKDCKYWENGKDYEPYCNHWGNMMTDTEPDDFCSYGERRTDDHT